MLRYREGQQSARDCGYAVANNGLHHYEDMAQTAFVGNRLWALNVGKWGVSGPAAFGGRFAGRECRRLWKAVYQ
jgi:hypothetical protein